MKQGTKNEFSYKPARLVTSTAVPYIVFYVWDAGKKAQVRVRYRLVGDTEEERAADAKRAIAEINKKLKDGWYIDDDRPVPTQQTVGIERLNKKITVYDAFHYYKEVKARDLRERTTMGLIDDYWKLLLAFLQKREGRDSDVAPHLRLVHFTPQLAHEFADSLTQGGRYRNNLMGWCKSFFTFFGPDQRGVVGKNPFAAVAKVPVDDSDAHRPFADWQTTALRTAVLDKGDRQLWLFCQFAYFLFLRPGQELRLLRVGDILDKRIRVVSQHGKNRKTGYVDIPRALADAIDAARLRSYAPNDYVFTIAGHPGPEPVGVNYFYKRFVTYLKALGMTGLDYDLYSWKCTGAVALYRHTKDILRVQRHCRHSSPDQTYTYLRKYGVIFEGQDLTDFPAAWSE